MIDISAEINDIEAAAKARGEGIQAVLDRAGLDRSTWTRWKSGATKPRLESWMAVKAALQQERAA